MVATFLRSLSDWKGDARLYRLEPPAHDGTEYVIASAVRVLGEPETYTFQATAGGEVTCWLEWDGSFKGELNHEQALARAGYAVGK